MLREDYPLPLTTRDISDRMSDPYADTSRVVDRLVKKGLCIKKSNKDDRRLVQIRITREGLELLSQIDLKQPELDVLTSHLPDDRIRELNSLLKELTEEHFQLDGKITV